MVRIVRLAGMAAGELCGHRLAQHDRARLHELRDAGGVAAGHPVAIDRRAAGRRQDLGVDDVLHRQRDAVQRPDRLRPLVELVGPLAGALGVDRLPGMDLALARLDAVETRLDQIARFEPLVGHLLDRVTGRQSAGCSRHVLTPRARSHHDDALSLKREGRRHRSRRGACPVEPDTRRSKLQRSEALYPAFTSILRVDRWRSAGFGMRTLSTPLLNLASTWPSFTSKGRSITRSNDP